MGFLRDTDPTEHILALSEARAAVAVTEHQLLVAYDANRRAKRAVAEIEGHHA